MIAKKEYLFNFGIITSFFGIIGLITSIIAPYPCTTSPSRTNNITITDWMLGLGITWIITGINIVLSNSFMAKIARIVGRCTYGMIEFVSWLLICFGSCWFILGAIIIFESNLPCIKQGSTHVIIAFVLWLIYPFIIIGNVINNIITNHPTNITSSTDYSDDV